MKARYGLALLGALLLGNAAPKMPRPTAAQLAGFRSDRASYRSDPLQPLAAWEEDLRRSTGTLDQAADALAPRYGLASAEMRALARLWFTVRSRQYDRERSPATTEQWRRQLLALLPATRRAPLVLQAVAESLNRLNACSERDFAAMMAGSADPAADAWAIASAASCGDNFLRAAAAAPDRSMPALIRLAHDGRLGAGDALPLYQILTSPAALVRIAAADRPALAAWLYGNEAELLFGAGLTDRAVALIDGLPEDLRRLVLTGSAGSFRAQVDGLPVTFRVQEGDESLKLDVAAAYALAGRTGEAEALFATLTRIASARRALDCAWSLNRNPSEQICRNIPYGQGVEDNVDLLMLDHLLHHPREDPYPIAEVGFAGISGPSTAPAELRCRVFADPQFADLCNSARDAPLYVIRTEPHADDAAANARMRAGLDALHLPGFAEARASTAAAFGRVLAARGGALPGTAPRQTVTPAPGPFAELPLPAAYRGPRPPAATAPRGVAALPEGFLPVRFERSGQRAVAISVSQTLDPTGEVSQGGYWVHLSGDGGRHWDRPLYTGLADHFPYVVPQASRLPLLNGDRLDLEVEVAELDTASITYPQVAMRNRRQASNLYLQIPLADLARDGNGDGITDIAAHNLLLDRARTDGGTPFIVGSDAGANCEAPAPAPAGVALIALLGQSFIGRVGALVEPIDPPIFIEGDPRDYLCLRPHRLMIVYGASDIAELQRFRPDFHAVRVSRIVYDRARDRGYVYWSAGPTGATYRLRLVDGRWTFETLGSWIS